MEWKLQCFCKAVGAGGGTRGRGLRDDEQGSKSGEGL
jgi:hypothetical protein